MRPTFMSCASRKQTCFLPLTAAAASTTSLSPTTGPLLARVKPLRRPTGGKGLLTLAHPSLAAHCPSSTAAAPTIKAVHEAVCDSFELLATVTGNVTTVSIYVHTSVAPDYPALKDAIEAVPGFIEANVLVTGDFNHPNFKVYPGTGRDGCFGSVSSLRP